MHIGHGLYGERLARMLQRSDVQLNLHNNPYPSFENRVCIALAVGHLVIAEPLSPAHGLTAGVDYIEIDHFGQSRVHTQDAGRDPPNMRTPSGKRICSLCPQR